jgi:hypothetical protein
VEGGAQRDVQRFEQDVVPTRLDGSATGWRLGAGASPWRRVAVAGEWSDGGEIADRRTTTLDVNGRTVTIDSTFRHRTRSLAALAGFAHRPAARLRLAYLIGIASTRVERTFTSTAAGTVLVPPSDTSASSPPLVDTFRAVTAGIDGHFRVARRVFVVAGLRTQRIALQPDQTGWSLRTFAGAAWMLIP